MTIYHKKMSITPESIILDQVCEYLLLKYGRKFWRVNNLPVYDPKRGAFRKMPKYSIKGVSDIILLHNRKAYFIECKRKYKYQSKEQKEFEKMVKGEGMEYLVVRSIEDLEKAGI